jgi:hypothetical protein
MRIEKQKSRSWKPEITGPMLFAHNALAPGPQACFPTGKSAAKVKVGKGGFELTRRFRVDYKGNGL